MADQKFLINEALRHGWRMTLKYWKPLLLIGLIYVGFNGANMVLQYFAGQAQMTPAQVESLYPQDRARGAALYQYFQECGYINRFGAVSNELQAVAKISDLTLTPDFENDRADIYDFLKIYRYRLPFPRPVYYALMFILWIVGMVMYFGIIRVSIAGARDQESQLSEFLKGGRACIPFVLATLAYMLITGFAIGIPVIAAMIAITVLKLHAYIPLVVVVTVPGVIVMIMFQMYSYLIVDKQLGVGASFARSREITRGQRLKLCGFGLLLILVNLAGFLCLGVGLFFSVWTSSIAFAYVYDRLEQEQGPEVPAVP